MDLTSSIMAHLNTSPTNEEVFAFIDQLKTISHNEPVHKLVRINFALTNLMALEYVKAYDAK